LLLALTSAVLTALYRIQIVEGAAYAAQTENSIISTVTIAAARGNILDRYGRVLVTNRTCNNITFNIDELFENGDAAANSVILLLANTVEDAGDSYTDELPITSNAPFEYLSDMTDVQRTRLDAYFQRNELSAATSAVELMAYFRDRYKIDPAYTSAEMRTISGIRYEINNRYNLGADYIFAEDVSIDLITRLMETGVPGFNVVSSFVREYNTSAAAHVLGYIGMIEDSNADIYEAAGYSANALVGRAGVESAFEEYLHGTDGEAKVVSTKGGTVISTEYMKNVEPGSNVALTLDIALQEVAESALKSFIETENAARKENNEQYEGIPGYEREIKDIITGGGVAVVEVGSGEPLAIASYPTFDVSTILDDYGEVQDAPNDPLFNRALMGAYAPGSTFKPLVALAALDNNRITTTTTIHDEGVYTKYEEAGGEMPKCWIYPGSHGDVNVTQAIEVSCNYFFYTLGDFMGIDIISNFAGRFGLGEPTGIELDESQGRAATPEFMKEAEDRPWYKGDDMAAAIGQSLNLFTPLQMALYTAALADNGRRYEASILKSVRSYDYSESFFERENILADYVNMDAEFYEAIQQGMFDAANNEGNTAYEALGDMEIKAAGKTGTAQLGKGITDNGIFICYAPYDNPQIAIAIAIEKGGSGAAVGSIARDILDYYFSFQNSQTAIETENGLLR
jgi:penicillin-binding protein 2